MAAMSTRLAGGALLGLGLWASGPAAAQQAYPRSGPHNSQRGHFERMLAYRGMAGQVPSGQAEVPPPQLAPSQPPPYPVPPPTGPPDLPQAPRIGDVPPPGAPVAPETSLPGEVPPPPGAVPPAAASPPEAGLPAAPAPTFGDVADFGTPAPYSGLGGTAGGGGLGRPGVIGDQLPTTRYVSTPARRGGPAVFSQSAGRIRPLQTPGGGGGGQPDIPGPQARSLFAPSIRGFKIADNMSPIPQDRIFYTFNYFNQVNEQLNRVFEAPIKDVMAYRHLFGLEKTIFGGKGSVGFRLPLNVVSASPREEALTGIGGTSSSLGNVTFFAKYILEEDPDNGNLLTVGLAVTPETGPRTFADAPYLSGLNATYIQPFAGYLINWDRFYLQGFTAIDVPSTDLDTTMIYNDIGLNYELYRSDSADGFITALVPTFEAHINTPLTHRGEYNLFDPSGTPDVVNLTYGLHSEFFGRAVGTFGFVTPVTGPRPFDFEVVAMVNVYFGGRNVRAAGRGRFPVAGG